MDKLPSAKSFVKATLMVGASLIALKLAGRAFPALKNLPVLGEAF